MTQVDLSGRTALLPGLQAEWWNENSKFAVVRGVTKDYQEFDGLRLDLEKRAFLDHVANPQADELVQSQAHKIAQWVWEERQEMQKEMQAAVRMGAA